MKLNTYRITIAFLIVLCQLPKVMTAQDRFTSIENQLKSLVVDMPGLEDKVELSVNDVSIEEFIRGMAITNKLNISVDPRLDAKIINNFSGVSVMDVLLFLAKEHKLQISFTGNIISISKYNAPPEKPVIVPPQKPVISYNSQNDLISIDVKNDSIDIVAREITTLTGKNVIVESSLNGKPVSGFIKEMPFETAIERFVLANNLEYEKTDDNFYLIGAGTSTNDNKQGSNSKSRSGRNNLKKDLSDGIEMAINPNGNITLRAFNSPISDIINQVSTELEIGYYMNSNITGNATIFVKDVTYENLLTNLFNATNYTFEKESGIYIMGERKIERLRETKLVQLQHRSIENVIDHIPGELKTGVDIKEFPDLNSIILSGSKLNIEEISVFLKHIDKVVPVILIEVLLIDYQTDRAISAGVRVGIGEEKAPQSAGTIYPNLNYNFNSESVNNIIQNLNGNGFLNLGKVTPNFYMSINALEEEGLLRVRSTPKLATLNGTEATLSIGNTEYYITESNNVIGSQNPQNIITRQYQSVNADLSVTIKPFVSGDDQITLDIQVQQSDFTARISPDAPPGSITRSFSSLLRVKNEEMILLGGLEQKSTRTSGSGIPFLSRIPVLKWLFSNRTYEKSKSKLNIFIKPTVLY